jgi:hypothetical protein
MLEDASLPCISFRKKKQKLVAELRLEFPAGSVESGDIADVVLLEDLRYLSRPAVVELPAARELIDTNRYRRSELSGVTRVSVDFQGPVVQGISMDCLRTIFFPVEDELCYSWKQPHQPP